MMSCKHQHLPTLSGPRTCDCGIEVHEVEGKWYSVPGNQNGVLSQIDSPAIEELFTNEQQIIRTRFHVLHDMISNQTGLYSPENKSRVVSEKLFQNVKNTWAEFGCAIRFLCETADLTYERAVLLSFASTIPELPALHAEIQEGISFEKIEDLGRSEIGNNEIERITDLKLKDEQRETIQSVLSHKGSATIAALPTGYGKTLISQACTLALREIGPTLVISPLISLIDDQEENYQKLSQSIKKKNGRVLNIRFLRSSQLFDIDEINYQLLAGNIDVLCCSPETLLMKAGVGLMETIRRLGIAGKSNPFSLFVIDEAHIVSDWGVTIRPQFMMLSSVIRDLVRVNSDIRLLFMSATISNKEEEFIKTFLCPNHTVNIIRKMEIRKDIAFKIRVNDELQDPSDFAVNSARWDNTSPFHSPNKAPFLIYTRSPKDAESIKDKLHQFGKIQTYTGETSSSQRGSLRRNFVDNKVNGIVGTSAFGMGINKSDLQCISYIGRPYSIKDLYQAFGRVSRNSNWEGKEKNQRRVTGNAIGIITPQARASPFRAELGVEKMLERLWDLMSSSIQISPTIIAFQTDTIPAYWEPKNNPVQEESFDDIDAEDPEIERKLPQHVIERLRNQKLRERAMHFQQWVISAFDLANIWKLEGIWHSSFYQEKGVAVPIGSVNENQNLEDLWAKVRDSDTKFKTSGSPVVLVRLIQPIDSFKALETHCESTRKILKEKHSAGAKEMQNLLLDPSCIRVRFGPAIGLDPEKNLSCIELNKQAMESEEFYVAPCSVCQPHYDLAMDEDEPCLWKTYEQIRDLVMTKETVKSELAYTSDWDFLPKNAIDVVEWRRISGKYHTKFRLDGSSEFSSHFLHGKPETGLRVRLYSSEAILLQANMDSIGSIMPQIATEMNLFTEIGGEVLRTIIWKDKQEYILRILPDDLSSLENVRLKIKQMDPELSELISRSMPHGNF